MSYAVVTLDLSQATTGPVRVFPIGQVISEVAILAVPAGASFQLQVGDAAMFTVNAPLTMEPVGSDLQTRGLYWQNPQAIPGAKVEMIVGFAEHVTE